MNIIVGSDDALFIAASIREVLIALSISLALVVLVILLFLRSFRATPVPAIAIPVSLIGCLSLVAAFGFSINVLTLLALLLAIGLVVDDAIVVLENIQRRTDLGESPLVASVLGTRTGHFRGDRHFGDADRRVRADLFPRRRRRQAVQRIRPRHGRGSGHFILRRAQPVPGDRVAGGEGARIEEELSGRTGFERRRRSRLHRAVARRSRLPRRPSRPHLPRRWSPSRFRAPSSQAPSGFTLNSRASSRRRKIAALPSSRSPRRRDRPLSYTDEQTRIVERALQPLVASGRYPPSIPSPVRGAGLTAPSS